MGYFCCWRFNWVATAELKYLLVVWFFVRHINYQVKAVFAPTVGHTALGIPADRPLRMSEERN
jgi:hypothetical protein